MSVEPLGHGWMHCIATHLMHHTVVRFGALSVHRVSFFPWEGGRSHPRVPRGSRVQRSLSATSLSGFLCHLCFVPAKPMASPVDGNPAPFPLQFTSIGIPSFLSPPLSPPPLSACTVEMLLSFCRVDVGSNVSLVRPHSIPLSIGEFPIGSSFHRSRFMGWIPSLPSQRSTVETVHDNTLLFPTGVHRQVAKKIWYRRRKTDPPKHPDSKEES